MNKAPLIIIACTLTVSACRNDTAIQTAEKPQNPKSTELKPLLQPEYNPVERYAALLWVEQADPVKDAQEALAKGKLGLWGYNTRIGPKLPGVEMEKVAGVLKSHDMQQAPAMGDTVHGNKHLELRLKFIDYAKQYNSVILKK